MTCPDTVGEIKPSDLIEECVMHRPSETSLNHAAFVLFAKQVESYDLPGAAVQMEWDGDPEIRAFWRQQVDTVVGVLAIR